MKSERQTSHNVSARDVEKIVPVENCFLAGDPKQVETFTATGFVFETYHNTQETYSPVGSKNLRMYWSGVQSTGAEMRKYFTIIVTGQNEFGR